MGAAWPSNRWDSGYGDFWGFTETKINVLLYIQWFPVYCTPDRMYLGTWIEALLLVCGLYNKISKTQVACHHGSSMPGQTEKLIMFIRFHVHVVIACRDFLQSVTFVDSMYRFLEIQVTDQSWRRLKLICTPLSPQRFKATLIVCCDSCFVLLHSSS